MSTHLPSRPPTLARIGAAAWATTLALALGACGDDDDGPNEEASVETTTTEDGAAAGEGIVAEDFRLSSVSVAPGAEVTVTNEGQAPHTATADDGAFDSGTVAAGETGSLVAPEEPGEYDFHCEIHPDMTGTLTVEG